MLRPLLPDEAFRPDPAKLVPAGLHLVVILAGWLAFRVLPPLLWPLLTLVIGHSIACCGLIAHELSHRSIVRGRYLTYPLELLLWGINIVPPTLWRRLHNESHHLRPNALDDPDRAYVAGERSAATLAFAFLFFPSRWFKYNPLCLLHFLTYVGRHAAAVWYPGASKPAIASFKPAYRMRDRAWIAAEFGFIALIQLLIFFLVGESWTAYLFAGPLAVCVTSVVIMVYIATNHMLNPLGDGRDPVAATTSVTVPPLLDRLHSNFSYHTEHHLFPSMNSKYHPLLSRLLRERFGASYRSLPLAEAWSGLWPVEYFMPAPRDAEADGEAAAP
jgi:fatty acid desaturase